MIGNIANNAYLNGKILNEAGIDCYACSIGYKHIMGCPEWEDADFSEQVDQLNPNWDAIELKGFVRPHWFISGELPDCMEKLYKFSPRQRPLIQRDCQRTLIQRDCQRTLIQLNCVDRSIQQKDSGLFSVE